MVSRIEEVEIEAEYQHYERLLEQRQPGDEQALTDAWNQFLESCAQFSIDWYPYLRRATAFGAAREYGRPYDAVLSDLQKWPRSTYRATEPDCYGGSCCAR